MVRQLAGMKEPSSWSPSQDYIDQRQDEINTMFDDRVQKTFATTCPHCEAEFEFAR